MWSVVVVVAAAFLLVDVGVRSSWIELLLIAPWLLLGAWAVVTTLALPLLAADARGVRIRNPLRTTSFGWSQVVEIESRWQLGFRLVGGRTVQAFGAPLRRGRRSAPDSDDGAQGVLLELRESTADGSAPVRTTWNLDVLIPLLALVVWAGIAVAVTR